MKKISLKNLNLKEVEQLSREQLKSVSGGFTGSGSGNSECTCSLKANDGIYYPVILGQPLPTTEAECSAQCESVHNTVNASGGKSLAWRAVWGSTGGS